MDEESVEYEVVTEDGEFCASSTDLKDAMHYAMVYMQDGPIRIVEVTRRLVHFSVKTQSSK